MATVKASEVGIERLHHAKESMGKSWEVVAEESRVAKATIFKLLKGDPVTREVVGDLATYFKLERREIVTDREWYPQWSGRGTGDLWKMLWNSRGRIWSGFGRLRRRISRNWCGRG
jgi:hypothetical protein